MIKKTRKYGRNYLEMKAARKAEKQERKRQERENFLIFYEEKCKEFDEILKELSAFFLGEKSSSEWLKLYDKNFKFYISCHLDKREKNIEIIENCMEKLILHCKGRKREERSSVYRLFSFWFRVPFLLGKYSNAATDFLVLTE